MKTLIIKEKLQGPTQPSSRRDSVCMDTLKAKAAYQKCLFGKDWYPCMGRRKTVKNSANNYTQCGCENNHKEYLLWQSQEPGNPILIGNLIFVALLYFYCTNLTEAS
ncbi:hypothetical protein ACH5RR_022073 [Cinchona calisaya]|uniref:Uncharacterized protein n=1 Tax=Cinchona calisaya TaxID=153742 RepID=A0ABD2Z8N3_9GENT